MNDETIGEEFHDGLSTAWNEAVSIDGDPLPDLSFAGEFGSTPGAFATTPTSDYANVAQSPTQGVGVSIDALMAGSKWSGQDAGSTRTVITYSFASPASTFSYSSNTEFLSSIASFSEADKATTRAVLANVEAVCNVDFVEVADNANECGVLRYGYSAEPNAMNASGYGFYPSSNAMGGDIWIGAAQAAAVWDFYRPDLILHETLHAIGLKHPFDTAGAVLATAQDIIPNTVMSYSPVAGGRSGWMSNYPSEPMPLDIAALQYLYGAAPTNTGDTTYDLAGADFQGFNAVWDAGGTDTLDASRLTRPITLDMHDGSLSDIGATVSAMARAASGATLTTTYTSTLAIATGAIIENAIGTNFNDQITGNDAANLILGGAGNDRLEGRGGNDTLDGGAGFDTAVVGGAHDSFGIAPNGVGFQMWGPTGLDLLRGIERIQFTDEKVALDIGGTAGTAAKFAGMVFGAGFVHDAGYMGLAINAADSMSADTLMRTALDLRLGAGASNQDVVRLLLTNLLGGTPSQGTIEGYTHLLDTGSISQVALAEAAANHELNLQHIDLVGLMTHGIEYA